MNQPKTIANPATIPIIVTPETMRLPFRPLSTCIGGMRPAHRPFPVWFESVKMVLRRIAGRSLAQPALE